ncbi:hypothetical protein GCM10008098_00280 [Rhodanobacter panaciterrae]|uniref:DoxX family protein n=2 Tax=Rhodanobacter panaciterrae TaxID=490572 RepID=A0ABQ2ZFC4_9GAMM|nr:hypothetical protein GCM10008098_00280 [Rhodanobacter panaciterrae]
MIALGIIGLIEGGFTVIWQPVFDHVPAAGALAYLCAFVSLACGAGLFWRRATAPAARVLFVYLLLWLLVFKLPVIVQSPGVEGSYQYCGEMAVVVAGAWVLYARFATDGDRRWLGFAIGDQGVRMARVLYGLALIAFGLSHFAYLNLTAPLVPGWLPAHVFWAYFTGGAYLAAGVAIIIGVCARLAAALSALQMGLFLLLIWVPMVAAGHISAFNWGETYATWVLTAAAWVVADSYRGMRWLAVGNR